MISIKKFVNDYNTFWNSLAPMIHQYIVQLNKVHKDSYGFPVTARDNGDRGLLNETAFLMNRYFFQGYDDIDKLFNKAFDEALLKIERLEGGNVDKNINRDETIDIFRSLNNFILEEQAYYITDNVTFSPAFKGCGFLTFCEGDFIIKNSLYEVKAGDRNFKGTDIRQILTYVCLNYISTGRLFEEVVLVNPRRSVFFKASTEDLSYSISGLTIRDFIQRVQEFLIGAEISK